MEQKYQNMKYEMPNRKGEIELLTWMLTKIFWASYHLLHLQCALLASLTLILWPILVFGALTVFLGVKLKNIPNLPN